MATVASEQYQTFPVSDQYEAKGRSGVPGAARRPPSGMRGRIPTGGRPPYRMPTGSGVMPGTSARPGSRGGMQGVGALGSQIKVADRPVTQQGLGGMKTGARGPMRQVQDKSYFLGMLRGKIQELNTEILKMTREIDTYNQESTTYLAFEKKAEVLAAEIKELQGEMADYNTLMDKLNTDTELAAVMADCAALQMQNEMERRNIDATFAERQEKELEVQQLEEEIEQEKRTAENIVTGMEPEMLERYQDLKTENARIEKDLEEKQDALDKLTAKVQTLEEEVAGSEIKQEAFRLHQQLSEAVNKRDEWREKDKETPQEERERLLKQVKADNQEIASIEKRTSELQERLATVQEHIQQADTDLEELQGERSSKYRELKKREETMNEFLGSFEESKATELERIQNLEANVVAILEHISQSMVQSQQLPSTGQFEEMQADLLFKQEEKEKSEATAKTLDLENAKLQMDLVKVEELEGKITNELKALKDSIETMTKEVEVCSDLQGLHMEEEEKRRLLAEEKEKLMRKRETAKKRTQDLESEYDAARTQLEANDTYTQLGNLERKWQHHEQNNFVMKEYIAARQAEGDYQQVAKEVVTSMKAYNSLLCQSLSGVAAN